MYWSSHWSTGPCSKRLSLWAAQTWCFVCCWLPPWVESDLFPQHIQWITNNRFLLNIFSPARPISKQVWLWLYLRANWRTIVYLLTSRVISLTTARGEIIQQNNAYNFFFFSVCIMNEKKHTSLLTKRQFHVTRQETKSSKSPLWTTFLRNKNTHLTFEEKIKLLIYPCLLYTLESCFSMQNYAGEGNRRVLDAFGLYKCVQYLN